jgi:hypothetical protein
VPLTKLEAELRLIARERIATGMLPCAVKSHIWAGHGSGTLCDLCDKPIRSDEVEYEVEDKAGEAVETFRFHMVCQAVWQLECARDDYIKKHP